MQVLRVLRGAPLRGDQEVLRISGHTHRGGFRHERDGRCARAERLPQVSCTFFIPEK